MRKIFTIALCLALSLAGMAQEVDNFEVGPYEVEYKGDGDYNFFLRKDVDLYKFYGLKKDTIVNVLGEQKDLSPYNSAIQLDVFMAVPPYVRNGSSAVYGIDGQWKRSIANHLYFNAGLSLGLSIGKYGDHWKNLYQKEWKKDGHLNETLFEMGIPLSIEFTSLCHNKSSLYVGFGVVPTLYFGAKERNNAKTAGTKTDNVKAAKAKANNNITVDNATKAGKTTSETAQKEKSGFDDNTSGFLIAPRLDFGGYVPVGRHLVRIGCFAQYDINCSSGDFNIFKERIGRFFVGANMGIVF